jgi:Ca2+-binding EF-hand superfamily protein
LQLVDDDPDEIPGLNDVSRQEIDAGFQAFCDKTKNGVVTREAFTKALLQYAPELSSERIDLALAEILAERKSDIDSSSITKDAWCEYFYLIF